MKKNSIFQWLQIVVFKENVYLILDVADFALLLMYLFIFVGLF